MARVITPDQAALSGRVKGVVYVHLNGQTYIRRAPRYNKKSETPGMLQNQKRFKEVNQFCAQFKDSVIPQLWNEKDPRMSGYSLFLKSNMSAFSPDGSLQDARKIKLSTGKLSFPEGLTAQRSKTDNHQIEVQWCRELHVGGIHLKDELMAIGAYDGKYSDITYTGITRSQLNGSFALPLFAEVPASESVYLYLFFASRDHRDHSDSICFEV